MANYQVFKNYGYGWFFMGAIFQNRKEAEKYVIRQMEKDWAENEDAAYDIREAK